MPQHSENPSREQIEQRAYEIYIKRGGIDGSDVADWIMAEEQLKAELIASSAEHQHSRREQQNTTAK